MDVNMEKIMARFNTYSQIISGNNSSNTTEGEEDEIDVEEVI